MCDPGQVLFLRLDIERGFQLEANYDYLTITHGIFVDDFLMFQKYRGRFTGGVENLPDFLKSGKWSNTGSQFLYLFFESDQMVQLSGFRIDVTCGSNTTGIVFDTWELTGSSN